MQTLRNLFKYFRHKTQSVDPFKIIMYGFMFGIEFYFIMLAHYNFVIFSLLIITFIELVLYNPKYEHLKDSIEKYF